MTILSCKEVWEGRQGKGYYKFLWNVMSLCRSHFGNGEIVIMDDLSSFKRNICSDLVHWEDPEGSGGEGGGKGDRDGEYM